MLYALKFPYANKYYKYMKIRKMRTITCWLLTVCTSNIHCQERLNAHTLSLPIFLTAINVSQAFYVGIVYCSHFVLLSKQVISKENTYIFTVHPCVQSVKRSSSICRKKFLTICRGNIFSLPKYS